MDVEMRRGRYGEFKVFVDEQMVVDAGARAVLGILPRSRDVVTAVRGRLDEP